MVSALFLHTCKTNITHMVSKYLLAWLIVRTPRIKILRFLSAHMSELGKHFLSGPCKQGTTWLSFLKEKSFRYIHMLRWVGSSQFLRCLWGIFPAALMPDLFSISSAALILKPKLFVASFFFFVQTQALKILVLCFLCLILNKPS